MFASLLTPALAPFTITITVMLLIAITEAMGTVFGISPSALLDQLLPEMDVDVDVDIDGDVPAGADVDSLSSVLGWLCIGKVPLLVLLVAFLTAFGLAGFAVQSAAHTVTGLHLPLIMAVPAALFTAVPPTRWLALGLSRLMPKEETEAVSSSSFIGKTAIITRGLAQTGMPAEAKLRDAHGQLHYVLVEPDSSDTSFPQGTEVLLTSQTSAIRFKAIANTNALMSSTKAKGSHHG
ncbi:MAG: YqiJ family protein [Hyphomicrobiaceae bacterium]